MSKICLVKATASSADDQTIHLLKNDGLNMCEYKRKREIERNRLSKIMGV